MHPRKLWLAVGLLTALAAQAAVIYKWVDADGVIHYSDQASPGAEKIYTSAPNVSSSTRPQPTVGGQLAQPRPPTGGLNYTDFSITAPLTNQTFFGDDVIAVHLNLAPALRLNHAITWHLNGKQLEFPPDAASFSLPHLDRGTYALAATITDQQTSESQSSNTVTFYVRQPSALAPQHK
ncbi:MAG: hypothetical protein QOK23_3571 [Gammaproteobacteria bacterium]|jgi:hypothetical protein|nr:hypothetical protein [Gammaproteobacteria bacterium]